MNTIIGFPDQKGAGLSSERHGIRARGVFWPRDIPVQLRDHPPQEAYDPGGRRPHQGGQDTGANCGADQPTSSAICRGSGGSL